MATAVAAMAAAEAAMALQEGGTAPSGTDGAAAAAPASAVTGTSGPRKRKRTACTGSLYTALAETRKQLALKIGDAFGLAQPP